MTVANHMVFPWALTSLRKVMFLCSKQDDVCLAVSNMLKEFSGYNSAITLQLFSSVRALPWPAVSPQLWQLWGSGSAQAWAIQTLNSFPAWFLQPCLADCFSCIYWGPMWKVALSLVFSPALSPWQTLDLHSSLVSRCLLLLLSGIYFHSLPCFDSQYHWPSPAEMLQGCVLLARSLSALWPRLAHSLQSPPRAACKSWEHWWTWLLLSGLH